MTLEELRQIVAFMREQGVSHLTSGDTIITLGDLASAPAASPAETKPEERLPRPVSPVTGKDMTDEEMVLYAATSAG